jgi:PAS domain S-box-containing protein
MHNHSGILVKHCKKWSLIEDFLHRKKTEENLKTREIAYQSLFSNMIDGFAYHKMLFDAQGKAVNYVFLEINDAFEHLTGLKREKILGRRVTDVLPGIEKDPADWIGIYDKVASTGGSIKFENFNQALSKWFLVSAYCPERGYFVATFEDITERKKAQETLRESEVKFRTVANFTYDWEYWIDPEGKLVYISPSCQRITGYSPEEFFKNPHLFKQIIHPEDRELVATHFDKVNSDKIHTADFRIITCNNEIRWIAHVCQGVFDDEGKWLGRRVSNRDITKRKQIEKALYENEQRWSTIH